MDLVEAARAESQRDLMATNPGGKQLMSSHDTVLTRRQSRNYLIYPPSE
jgi:hypothetical protein